MVNQKKLVRQSQHNIYGTNKTYRFIASGYSRAADDMYGMKKVLQKKKIQAEKI